MRAFILAALAVVTLASACAQRCANANEVCDPTGCAGVQLQQSCGPVDSTCVQCLNDGGYALRLLCIGSDDAGYWSADMCAP